MHERRSSRAFRVGIAGPVGSGKTALVDRLSRRLWPKYNLAVVTNDIYTKEDAEFLLRQGVLPGERVRGVETGACPHAAIREDASMNLQAIAELEDALPGLQLIFVESGGDKFPRKGGPGITRSDLLVINKIDLAPYVGASLDVMERDSRKMRGERLFLFTNLRDGVGLDRVVSWLEEKLRHPVDTRRALIDAHAPHAGHGHQHGDSHDHDHGHEHADEGSQGHSHSREIGHSHARGAGNHS